MVTLLIAMALAAPGMSLLTSTTPLSIMPPDNVAIVDARNATDFEAGHIPGALHLDASDLSETFLMIPGMLKPLNVISGMLAERGIVPDKQVVVYSGGEGVEGVMPATRIFWVLDYLGYPNASVLDGGFKKWTAEGHKVEQGKGGAPMPVPISELISKLNINPDLSIMRDEVWRMADKGTGLVVDARKPEQFTGVEKKEEIKKAGHIKGAINVSADTLLDKEHGIFKRGADLDSALVPVGAPGDKPIAVYCNTGRSASVLYFALRQAGYPKVSLYDGSMAEWASFEDAQIETGEK